MLEVLSAVSPTPILLAGFVCLLAAYFGWAWGRDGRLSKIPRGPTPWPVFGNISWFGGPRPHKLISELKKSYGNLVLLKMFWVPMVIIQDHRLMKEAFGTHGDKTSGRPVELFDRTKRVFGGVPRGILMNMGEPFRAMRKFSSVALRDFGVGKESVETKVVEEIKHILDLLLETPKIYQSGHVREVCQMGMANVVGNICFGKRWPYDSEDLQTIVRLVSKGATINPLNLPETYFPFLSSIPFYPDKLEEFISSQENIISILQTLVDEHRVTYDPDVVRDFTDLYLKEEASGAPSNRITAVSVFRTMIDLFSAGAETTATGFSWILFFLCNYPEIQDRVSVEVAKAVASTGKLTYKDRSETPYTEAFLDESMRLGNVAALLIPHTVTEDFFLGESFIPKGMLLTANLDAIHMDEGYWGDPHTFRPDRFLDSYGKHTNHEAFVPFSVGPRHCPGMSLARLDMYQFLVNLVQRAKVTFSNADTGRPIDQVTGITLTPATFELLITAKDR